MTISALQQTSPGQQSNSAWLTQAFTPISLAQLNTKADMLERRDNKYVVRAEVLAQAMAELSEHFDVLEINGQREFGYNTCYFDDEGYSSYFDHHEGRRIRCKIRMRKYVEAGLCFVEIKLKHNRGMTIKKRLQRPVDCYGRLDDEAIAFIHDAYGELYGREFTQALRPTLEMCYQRITLVAKQGGERMTIDYNLQFSGPSGSRRVGEALYLVETKSANANGIADKILRQLHQHPTNTCSKYCVAIAALEEVRKYNKFLEALNKLEMRPETNAARVPVTRLSRQPDAAGMGWSAGTLAQAV